MDSSPFTDLIWKMVEADRASTVSPRLSSGLGDPVVVGGRSGRFNFDVEPEAGGTPGTRYAFDTDDGGRWFYQLEKAYQGGRWENADHARSDYERYSGMDGEDLVRLMDKMWGQGSDIGRVISVAASAGVPFDVMVKALSNLNTHRQISYGEPKVGK